MNKRVKAIFAAICWIAVAMWMVMIFCMSAKVATESSAQSGLLIRTVASMFYGDYNELTPDEQTAIVLSMQHFVRKLAHFAEYFTLGALLCIAVGNHTLKLLPRALISFLAGVVYAVSDEVHQMFVPGRAGMVRDVLLDGAGVAAGTVFIILVTIIITKLFKHKIKSE